MYAGKVELCGVDTARLPVLSEAEKSRLIKAARAGDRQARQEMVQGNLRLVLSVVQRFAGRGENMDDLFQVGCIGLIKAIDNFDPAQNVRFSTYGVPMIVGEVKRYLRDNNAVRVSRSIRDLAYHSMQARVRPGSMASIIFSSSSTMPFMRSCLSRSSALCPSLMPASLAGI